MVRRVLARLYPELPRTVRDGNYNIYVVNANGGHVVRVTHTARAYWNTQPDWQSLP